MTSKEIRESFKQFFESKGHKIVPSAPMVVKNDPTLMFTNAGMNQFKDIFLGNKQPQYNRVADSQKCLRVSGKHNDLEEVGHDTYHHTMFEMLGNWSFGDYFKKEAISWAWEYLVDVLKIDKNRLYATVFEGYAPENLKRDDEAAQIWSQFLPKERIINGNKKDNFWEMGETGPCGPCSEIHIDLRSDEDRKKIDGRELVNGDSPEVIEIWNNVFMQFNRMADGHLEPLPAKHVDTGLGFERLCMVIQGKKSNYDTDVFKPILDEISNICNIKYGQDKKTDIAMRVIADHLRAVSFSITDGQLPSNAKAGYVIRRILRRAVRYGYTFLGMKYAFIYQLVPALIESMGGAFPELEKDQKLIEKVIKQEEDSFLRTLANGIKMLDNAIKDLKAKGKDTLEGKDIFTLYDTFGFPVDLTTLILGEQNLKGDIKAFEKEMNIQRERAKKDASIDTEDWIILSKENSEFIGYDKQECQTKVVKYRKVTQKGKEFYQIVLSTTPFYGEMGGQIGDTGYLEDSTSKYNVINTIKENDLTIHLVDKMPNVKETLKAVVNTTKRNAICANHSATHLIDAALRKVLGNHIEQKGSYVTEKALRFDFSHFSKVTKEELREVEEIVNSQVREDIPLNESRHVPIAEAKKMGAIALFSEKYGEDVRVIKFGESVELCGGTHVVSTGKIGSIRIISETAVAAGIRRIEAITGEQADKLFYKNTDTLNEIKTLFNNPKNILQIINKVLEENADLKKQIENFESEKNQVLKNSLIKQVQDINGIKFIKFIGEAKAEAIKDIAFQLKNEFKEKFAFAAGYTNNGKPGLTIMFSDDLVKNGKHAGKLIREAAKAIKGGGGGQPHFASAGGKDSNGLEKAIKIITDALK